MSTREPFESRAQPHAPEAVFSGIGLIFADDSMIPAVLVNGERISAFNQAARRLYGVDLTGNFAGELCDPSSRPKLAAALAQTEPMIWELQVGRAGAYAVPTRFLFIPLSLDVRLLLAGSETTSQPTQMANALLELTNKLTDLTRDLAQHRWRAELANAQLDEERRFINTIFSTVAMALVVTDRAGRIERCNPECERVTGLRPEELYGSILWETPTLQPEHRDALRAAFRSVAESGGRRELEAAFRDSSGHPRILYWTIAAWDDDRRPPSHMVAAGLDVTERRRLEVDVNEHKRIEEALRDADKRKSAFLSVLSHELRNPLAPIRNSLYILERTDPGSEQARKAQTVISRQVTHLTRLVDDLLDVTRIEQGKVQLKRERLDLGEVVRRTKDDYRADFEARGIQLEGPLGPDRFFINGDVTRVAQIIGNLLGNAAKFTPRAGKVELSLRREGSMAVIQVSDNGVGIAHEILGHLFEPFTQAPQTLARSQGGLGLGLAVVKGLCELHGGSIDVASEGPGGGATFTVRLPLEATASSAVAPPAPPTPPARPRRVLVIDDNVDAANSLRDLLQMGGHDVRVAFDGPTGIAMAHDFRPQVVLCDIGLPGMSGYDVVQALHADADVHDALFVSLTGYALPEDQERAAKAGFTRHLAKPATLEALNHVLNAARERDASRV